MKKIVVSLVVVVMFGSQVLSAAQISGLSFEAQVGQGVQTVVRAAKAKTAAFEKNAAYQTAASSDEKALFGDKADKSRFDRLKELFVQGHRPSKNDLVGSFGRRSFDGRCYQKDSPNFPNFAQLVVNVAMVRSEDNGPLFPSKSYLDGTFWVGSLVDASGADSIWLHSRVDGGVLLDKNYEARIHKHGAYLFSELVKLKGGDVVRECYFFQ